MMPDCFFEQFQKCNTLNKPLIICRTARIKNVIACSKLRGDNIAELLENELATNTEYIIQCHKSCVSTYTSKHHIKRQATSAPSEKQSELQQPKRSYRSKQPTFDFKNNCLFCGEQCQLQPDPRHPNRWKRAMRCATAGQGPHDFKQAILRACDQRGDEQASNIRLRIQGCLSDLHAADAIYHSSCHSKFMSERNINAAKRKSVSNEDSDEAFEELVVEMDKKKDQIWNSRDIEMIYRHHQGIKLSRRTLINRLENHFGTELLVLSGQGIASILVFRSKATQTFHIIDDQR